MKIKLPEVWYILFPCFGVVVSQNMIKKMGLEYLSAYKN